MTEDNSQLMTLANGAVYDRNVGRIVSAPTKQPITQENASAMANLRWEAYRQAAAEGAMRATKRDSTVAAWSYIVERQAELAIDIDKGRSSTEAARFVRDGLGLTPQAEQSQPSIRIEISGDVLASLAGIVAGGLGLGSGDVIDGEISEAAEE